MNLSFKKPSEIVQQLGARLRRERLLREWTQAELAQRAGVGLSTVSNLEAGRNISFETLVCVAMVLGRGDELDNLFQPNVGTLEDLKRLDATKGRQRIRSKLYD